MKLSALRAPAAAPALTSALNDRSERVRAAAITGLGLLGDPKLAPVVAARLSEDKRPFVRKTAAYALGRLRSPDGTPALVAALKDRNAEVRSAAAFALGEYQDSSAVEPLIAALADKSDFVRAQAARALGTNGGAASRALPNLIRLLTSDKENEVKRQAAITLGRIGDRAALPALNRTQYDPDPHLSLAALSAINMIHTKDQTKRQ